MLFPTIRIRQSVAVIRNAPASVLGMNASLEQALLGALENDLRVFSRLFHHHPLVSCNRNAGNNERKGQHCCRHNHQAISIRHLVQFDICCNSLARCFSVFSRSVQTQNVLVLTYNMRTRFERSVRGHLSREVSKESRDTSKISRDLSKRSRDIG